MPLFNRVTSTCAALLLLLLAGVVGFAVPASAQGAPALAADPPANSTFATTPQPLVLIGVAGLRWEDLSPETTPALWAFAQSGAVGSLVVRNLRSTTCPADGWLALSSGSRSADLMADQRVTDTSLTRCRVLQESADGTTVPGWADYVTANTDTGYVSRIGLLGDELVQHGRSAVAIGPGAAIALATTSGTVAGQVIVRPEDPEGMLHVVTAAAASSDVVVVDAGEVLDWIAPPTPEVTEGEEPPPAPEAPNPDLYRAEQVAAVEATVAAALAGAQAGSEVRADGATPLVIVASLADSGRTPALQVLAAAGMNAHANPDDARSATGTLVTSSTRQDGFVLATDLLPWVLDTLGLELTTASAASLVGAGPTLISGPPTPEAGDERIASLEAANAHAQAQRPLIAPFYLLLVIANVALYVLVALGLARPTNRLGAAMARALHVEDGAEPLHQIRPRVLTTLRWVSVALAAVPVSTLLANLLPWWRLAAPAFGLLVGTALFVVMITLIALASPWRERILAPFGIVAGITAAVLAVDVLTGATLQLSAVMGVPPMVAGRFYGFNNTSFTLFTTATILLCVALTDPLVRRGRRALAAVVVATIGIIATVLDGAPSIGADFGGPPAMVPAFAVLTLMAAGIRLTWRRIAAVLGGAVLATAAFAVVDYLRPAADRSHLGRFVETVLDGGAWEVVLRKLEANLRIFANNRPLTILAVTGVALVVFVLARPVSKAITSPGGGRFGWLSSGAPISHMGEVTPMLKPGLISLALALGIGFAVNDSGIAIPAYGVMVAVPLLLAACASWMLPLGGDDGAGDTGDGNDGAGSGEPDQTGTTTTRSPAASSTTTSEIGTGPDDPPASSTRTSPDAG